jgi:hypothetical protein
MNRADPIRPLLVLVVLLAIALAVRLLVRASRSTCSTCRPGAPLDAEHVQPRIR